MCSIFANSQFLKILETWSRMAKHMKVSLSKHSMISKEEWVQILSKTRRNRSASSETPH